MLPSIFSSIGLFGIEGTEGAEAAYVLKWKSGALLLGLDWV